MSTMTTWLVGKLLSYRIYYTIYTTYILYTVLYVGTVDISIKLPLTNYEMQGIKYNLIFVFYNQ